MEIQPYYTMSGDTFLNITQRFGLNATEVVNDNMQLWRRYGFGLPLPDSTLVNLRTAAAPAAISSAYQTVAAQQAADPATGAAPVPQIYGPGGQGLTTSSAAVSTAYKTPVASGSGAMILLAVAGLAYFLLTGKKGKR